MQKWEYRIICTYWSKDDIYSDEDVVYYTNKLNDLGEDGWEVVGAYPAFLPDDDIKTEVRYILKRPKINTT